MHLALLSSLPYFAKQLYRLILKEIRGIISVSHTANIQQKGHFVCAFELCCLTLLT